MKKEHPIKAGESRQKEVNSLIRLLETRPDLKAAIVTSISKSRVRNIKTLTQFYDFLDRILTKLPPETELMESVRKFYFILAHSPGNLLQKDSSFNRWIKRFVLARGKFMDSPESSKGLKDFLDDKDYKIDDYEKPGKGWRTYNEFLARKLKKGKRPVDAPGNDNIIVSPADFTFRGFWPISKDSMVTAKGSTYSIAQLLKSSRFKSKFRNGIFAHGFLEKTDYHHMHAPVSGIVKEIRHIPAQTWVHEKKLFTGKIKSADDVGFQFDHTRAVIIVDSAIGYLALIPVGMGHISSVKVTVKTGKKLKKGDEFAYFAFGGSDLIILFQRRVLFTAKKKKHYNMGEQIAITPE